MNAAAHIIFQRRVAVKIYIVFSSVYYYCCLSPSSPQHRPRQNVVNIGVLMVERAFHPFPIPQTHKSGVEHWRRGLAFLAWKPPACLLAHFKVDVHVRRDELRRRQRDRRKRTRRRKIGGAIADREGNKHARQVVILNSEVHLVSSFPPAFNFMVGEGRRRAAYSRQKGALSCCGCCSCI